MSDPRCLIVLAKVFASKGDTVVTNAVIDKIAEKYGLLVVDNSDLSHTKRPDLHCYSNNPHFGKYGNMFLADRFVTEIAKWIHEDPHRGEFGYTPRQNLPL